MASAEGKRRCWKDVLISYWRGPYLTVSVPRQCTVSIVSFILMLCYSSLMKTNYMYVNKCSENEVVNHDQSGVRCPPLLLLLCFFFFFFFFWGGEFFLLLGWGGGCSIVQWMDPLPQTNKKKKKKNHSHPMIFVLVRDPLWWLALSSNHFCCFFCSTPCRGEKAFKDMCSQVGWAVNPMFPRMDDLPKDLPMSLIYGSESWMDITVGKKVKAMRHDSRVDYRVCALTPFSYSTQVHESVKVWRKNNWALIFDFFFFFFFFFACRQLSSRSYPCW